jgi:hypothetical protein
VSKAVAHSGNAIPWDVRPRPAQVQAMRHGVLDSLTDLDQPGGDGVPHHGISIEILLPASRVRPDRRDGLQYVPQVIGGVVRHD